MDEQGPLVRRLVDPLVGSPPSAGRAGVVVIVAAVIAAAGALFYFATADVPPSVARGEGSRHAWVVELELSGSSGEARRALGFAGTPGAQDLDRATAAARRALVKDIALILSYAVAVVVMGGLGGRLFTTPMRRRLALAVASGGLAAAILDIVENVALWIALDRLTVAGDAGSGALRVAAVAATFKFALLAVALPVSALAAVAVLKRVVGSRVRRTPTVLRGKVYVPGPVVDSRGKRWPRASSGVVAPPGGLGTLPDGAEHHRYERMVPGEREPARTGFCVSGGGIRSACVTLGALQALRSRLRQARYLVSVSGGGYMAGATQLALTPPEGETAPPTTPEHVYAAGSVEEAHTRRHGNYIADGAKEWMLALVAVLRGLSASIAILVATILTAGLAFSFAYESVPLFGGPEGLETLTGYFTGEGKGAPPFPAPTGYSGWAIAVGALVTLVVWLVSVMLIDARSFVRSRRVATRLARAAAAGTAVLVVLVLVVPAVAWGAAWLASVGKGESTGGRAVGGSVLTFVATYFGALVSILWRQRKTVETVQTEAKRWFSKKPGDKADGGGSSPLVQRVIVTAVLALLLVFALAAFGAAVATGSRWGGWAAVPPAILLIVQLGVDQTWMSLHPFYRSRLSTAFAVRRRELPDGDVAAEPYDFSEGTWLGKYGKPHEGFPQVIFACAANLSGSDRTPPGRRAVSYTMSYDYIGGPDVGYAPTGEVRRYLSGPLETDMTVQAAMAISGAAFASAMGRQAKAFQTLLAISNARLGTWLPNPVYLEEVSAEGAPWWLPGLPRIRRLTYFLREIVGYFPQDDRLLLVTDGGHYENLGLVELLRHRVRVAYCIDASGDSPPFPETLCEAITLAKEELGVDIELDMLDLLPGSAEPVGGDALKSLSARLSKTSVAIGTIRYPEPFRLEGEAAPSADGVLVFAKALLTPDMPPDLLAYAHARAIFPRDSTGDQWFSHDQFDAYVELGRHIGRVVLEKTGGATG